jgi:twitching motility protein PilT
MRAAAPVAEPEPPAPVPVPEPVVAAALAPEAAPVAVPSPQPVAAAAATPSPYDLPGRFDTPMPAAWSTLSSPRFDSHPHESSRYGAVDSHPVLPGLASELDAIERESAAPDSLPAVVLSLTRDGARGSGGGVRGGVRPGGIERLLRLAAARGASALYLTTQARPAVRVDGDIRLLDGEAALSSGDVEAAVLELAPEGARDKESAEWIRDLADVGRVRITTFRDYRGPGALLRMIQARATSADQLGLVREIQALATEPEGLVIVTGPRASGKSTLVSAFVDLINRQRNDYVITLEGQIRLVHESRGSLISQRELRGSASEVVTAARAALRENPDVLVIEDLRSPDVLQVALDAAGSGLLVFVSVTAASATAALERLVDLCPSDQRRNVRAALAEHLRGVVAQVLLRKAGGGRLAARELVLNTNAVAALVSDGQIAQLPRAIDSGRKLGMAPLNDALVAFVQSGAVDVREAYRKADDKAGLLALMRREGIDTSFVERLA